MTNEKYQVSEFVFSEMFHSSPLLSEIGSLAICYALGLHSRTRKIPIIRMWRAYYHCDSCNKTFFTYNEGTRQNRQCHRCGAVIGPHHVSFFYEIPIN